MVLQPKAFIFDLNGTMIDDMEFHIQSWHRILNELGAELSYEQVKDECYGKNHELLERIFPGRFSDEEKNRMSNKKERQYQKTYRPHLKLINGLPELLNRAKTNQLKMAIGSAAIKYNIDFVLDGLNIRDYFDAIISADDVCLSKPDPETFLKCAAQLHLYPWECIVFEDAPKGVEAAANAGMKAVVITTMNTKEDFKQYDNVILFVEDYTNLGVDKMLGCDK